MMSFFAYCIVHKKRQRKEEKENLKMCTVRVN